MFQQVVSSLSGATDTSAFLRPPSAPLSGEALFESIRARLDDDLPRGVYISDQEFAKLLGIEMKTLANTRSAKPLLYPKPMKLGGGRGGKHARCDIVHWLAVEEFRARTQIVHRCQ